MQTLSYQIRQYFADFHDRNYLYEPFLYPLYQRKLSGLKPERHKLLIFVKALFIFCALSLFINRVLLDETNRPFFYGNKQNLAVCVDPVIGTDNEGIPCLEWERGNDTDLGQIEVVLAVCVDRVIDTGTEGSPCNKSEPEEKDDVA